jgi:hypothetical protein
MSILVCTLQGRTGNQVMQYLFARAFAELYGLELRMDPWIGERIFDISHPRPESAVSRRWNEVDFRDWRVNLGDEPWTLGDVEFRGYAQSQDCMIYRKRDAQAWLKLRPEIETACARAVMESDAKDAKVVCHHRRGDLLGYGYPQLTRRSYELACNRFGLTWRDAVVLSEECPIPHAGHLPDDLSFLPDFYRMMTAPTLLRGNSSFSWLAGLLGDGLVLAPIVDGLEGGKEHDCAFVAGNWPRFTNLDFVTNLHVSP